MAEEQPEEGWKVVASKRPKANATHEGQDQPATPKQSSGFGSRGRFYIPPSASRGAASSASKSKRRKSSSKSKARAPDTSLNPESEGRDIGSSEPLSTATPASDVSPITPLPPSSEIPSHSLQALQLASSRAVSPAKSPNSSADDGYITAQQTPEPSTAGDMMNLQLSPSSSEAYDTAEEGGTLSRQGHEPTEKAKGKQKESFEGPSTPVLPQQRQYILSSPDVAFLVTADEITSKRICQTLPQVQPAEETVKNPDNRFIPQTINNNDKLTGGELKESSHGNKETQSGKHNIINLENVPQQTGSRSSAQLTTTSPVPNTQLSSTVKTKAPNDPEVHLATEQPGHSSTSLHESSRKKGITSDDEVKSVADGQREVVINYGQIPLGHTVDTIQEVPQPSSTTDTNNTRISSSSTNLIKDRESSSSSSTTLEATSLDTDSFFIKSSEPALELTTLYTDPTHIPVASSTPLESSFVNTDSSTLTSTSTSRESSSSTSTINPSFIITSETDPYMTSSLDIQPSSTVTSSSVDTDPSSAITTSFTSHNTSSLQTDPSATSDSSSVATMSSSSKEAASSSARDEQGNKVTISTSHASTSIQSGHPVTSSSTSKDTMSTTSNETASSSTRDEEEIKDEETTPKPKFAQLALIPESEEPKSTTASQSKKASVESKPITASQSKTATAEPKSSTASQSKKASVESKPITASQSKTATAEPKSSTASQSKKASVESKSITASQSKTATAEPQSSTASQSKKASVESKSTTASQSKTATAAPESFTATQSKKATADPRSTTSSQSKNVTGGPQSTIASQSKPVTHSAINQAARRLLSSGESSSSSLSGSSAAPSNTRAEFANFNNASNLPELRAPQLLTAEAAAAIVPRMSANELSLTGLNVVNRAGQNPSAASRPVLPPRAQQIFAPPPPRASGAPRRRSHAIPIRAPLPEPGFARPAAPLQRYTHGQAGIPSHYIPMQGACHGMFYDPMTKMFVGDGPPRPQPLRADGTGPCTPRANAPAVPVSQQPADLEDGLHVQTAAHHESIRVAAARAAAEPPARWAPGTVPSSFPTRPFGWFFCRCTGKWTPQQHNCPDPPPSSSAPLPSGQPILPGTVLPPTWVTHGLAVDARIYPGGVVPATGSPAAMTTSAVGWGPVGSMEGRVAPVVGGTVVGGAAGGAAGGTAAGGAAGAGAASGAGEDSSAGGTVETHVAGGETLGGDAQGKKKKKNKRAGKKRDKGKGKAVEEEGPGEGEGEAGMA